MLNVSAVAYPLGMLLIATLLEVTGDAVVRMAIYQHTGAVRLALFVCGAALLLGYGSCVNLARIDFNHVVGLYIATLFVVWQVVSFAAFRSVPNLPILCGGGLIIVGGLIVSFWKPA